MAARSQCSRCGEEWLTCNAMKERGTVVPEAMAVFLVCWAIRSSLGEQAPFLVGWSDEVERRGGSSVSLGPQDALPSCYQCMLRSMRRKRSF